jgi:allophanate hydrolase
MIKVLDRSGAAVYLELFSVPTLSIGRFLQQIPPPLGLGTVELEDGSSTLGFICEGYVKEGGPGIEDITHLGSWHAYVESKAAAL